ncbi:MAG: hypothetical protein NTZ80_01320 [Patescibacteria group bacterium]|nr:hypothetical protein [Patescibacteria group bacterium]
MKHSLSEQEIINALKQGAGTKPSKEWQEQTLLNLRAMANNENLDEPPTYKAEKQTAKLSPNPLFNSLNSFHFSKFYNNITMRKIYTAALAVIVVLAIVFGYQYNRPNNIAERHLAKARQALEELQKLSGAPKETASIFSFLIQSAYAADEETTGAVSADTSDQVVTTETEPVDETVAEEVVPITSDEIAIQDLIETVVAETEAAIEASEEISDVETISEVLTSVDQVQDETVETLSDVIEVAENQGTIEVVEEAIETTTNENQAVEEAIETAADATANSEDSIVVEIDTAADNAEDSVTETSTGTTADTGTGSAVETGTGSTADTGTGDTAIEPTHQELKQIEKLERAKALLLNINPEQVELSLAMQKKYTAVQAIIAQCETSQDKCQAGKAKGLATALAAKVRNQERKAGKNENHQTPVEPEGNVVDGEIQENTEGSITPVEPVETEETIPVIDAEEAEGTEADGVVPVETSDATEQIEVEDTTKGNSKKNSSIVTPVTDTTESIANDSTETVKNGKNNNNGKKN